MKKPRAASTRTVSPNAAPAPALSALRSKMRPVSRTSVSDEIVEQIMALIASGDLKPGQRLPSERELCKTFQTGRPSLREAIRALCIVGVLQARVGDGTSVAPDGKKFLGKIVEWRLITEKHDIENLFEVRMALEGVAVAHAAVNADAALIADLQDILSRLKLAVQAKSQRQFVELDLEFHVAIAAAAKNDLLFDLISMIRSQIAHGLARVAAHPRSLPLTLKEHGVIVRAMKEHDPQASAAAMQHHLELSSKRYREAIERPPLPAFGKPSRARAVKKLRAVTRSGSKVRAK